MLLDQKRTRRMVVIVSIICAAAFVGVLPIVLGLVVFGDGGSGSQTQQILKDAENRVEATPDSIDALVALAALYRGANRTQDEAVTLQKAMGVGAKNNEELQLLLGGLSQQVGQRLQVLQTYTKAHPKDADAFLTYGQTAETANQTLTARLAYQRAQQLAPKGSTLSQNAKTALDRLKATPAAPTPAAPTPTAAAPVTPGSPVTP